MHPSAINDFARRSRFETLCLDSRCILASSCVIRFASHPFEKKWCRKLQLANCTYARRNFELLLAMPNLRTHPSLLTSNLSSTFTRSFCTHLVRSPVFIRRGQKAIDIEFVARTGECLRSAEPQRIPAQVDFENSHFHLRVSRVQTLSSTEAMNALSWPRQDAREFGKVPDSATPIRRLLELSRSAGLHPVFGETDR